MCKLTCCLGAWAVLHRECTDLLQEWLRFTVDEVLEEAVKLAWIAQLELTRAVEECVQVLKSCASKLWWRAALNIQCSQKLHTLTAPFICLHARSELLGTGSMCTEFWSTFLNLFLYAKCGLNICQRGLHKFAGFLETFHWIAYSIQAHTFLEQKFIPAVHNLMSNCRTSIFSHQ